MSDDNEYREAFTEQGLRLIRDDDWNKVRVKALGNRIQVWLNGELRTDLVDDAATAGVIGFQVHSVFWNFFEVHEVRFRNVRIAELQQ